MGIHGLLAQIGHGQRISLAKLSAEYYTANDRPFRLAIDISIWLFQIQSGKGGSNPALRTFYYRLLRLLSLNIHPLFVFDGPNKPLFKRNKKVGGPGVRVASVPEFLAKQLLKQFGFPWHVAPGEAEAECALLQREAIVDAVLSEDVDTLMFGSKVTLRSWTAENSTKSPTHVDLHRDHETKESSGMDREGMILVALMSGGDYLPEGIPGCGPKVACDAARAGFGRDLCALGARNTAGLKDWKDRLLHEIKTNESKFFTRRNNSFTIPEEFPNREVLGFYTHPCVSTTEKLARLRRELKWDQAIDFAALRSFAGDAFDWRCISGAKKFIKNLAPALLVRQLRLAGDSGRQLDLEAQEQKELELVHAIHGKRNHSTTDGELEYRISIVPEKLVPIDLSIEDEDDEIVPAGAVGEGSDVESEFAMLPSSTQDDAESEAPASPTKKRNFRPYNPSYPEKLWILRPFLQVGCPLMVEEYESAIKDPREFLKQRRKAKAAGKTGSNIQGPAKKASKTKAKEGGMPANALMSYAKATKPGTDRSLKELDQEANDRSSCQSSRGRGLDREDSSSGTTFKLPSTQVPSAKQSDQTRSGSSHTIEVLDLATDTTMDFCKSVRPMASSQPAASTLPSQAATAQTQPTYVPSTPRRGPKKRQSAEVASPTLSQRTITSFYTPSPRKNVQEIGTMAAGAEIIDLISSPIPEEGPTPRLQGRQRSTTPTPPDTRFNFVRCDNSPPLAPLDFSPGKLSDNVTKRRKKTPLKRWQTEPTPGSNLNDFDAPSILRESQLGDLDVLDNLAADRSKHAFAQDHDEAPSSTRSEEGLVSPSSFLPTRSNIEPGAQSRKHHDGRIHPAPKSLSMDGADESEEPKNSATQADLIQNESFTRPVEQSTGSTHPLRPAQSISEPSRKSPRQQVASKKRVEIRESLEGSWKETVIETIDMTGDGSGWKRNKGKAELKGWRKSGVEVLDLTGA